MDRPHLKLFDPHDGANSSSLARAEKSQATSQKNVSPQRLAQQRVVGEARVAVSVGDLLPLLADAWESKRAWLNDFSSDRVIVSQDLYEVLLAYKRMRRAG